MHPLPLYLLTNVLGVLFIFLGNIKLTPQFFPEYYEQCRQQFGILNKEFPFYHQTHYRPLPKSYRTTVGAIETGAGTLLILGYRRFHVDISVRHSFFCPMFQLSFSRRRLSFYLQSWETIYTRFTNWSMEWFGLVLQSASFVFYWYVFCWWWIQNFVKKFRSPQQRNKLNKTRINQIVDRYERWYSICCDTSSNMWLVSQN